MPENFDTVTINLLGRDYQISCPPNEEEALRKAARYLNTKMEALKSHSTTLGFEKLAVMTALNLSHDLLEKSENSDVTETQSLGQIKTLQEKVEQALQSARQMEI